MKIKNRDAAGVLVRSKFGNLTDYILIIIGSCIFSVGIAVFVKPAMISMGGVAGIALIGNYLFNIPIGFASLVLNIPLFIVGYKLLGKEFFVKTMISSVSYSVFMDTVGTLLPAFEGDKLLATLYGGIIMGLGFGLVFCRGGTTGGTDIIAKYLNEKFDVSIGNTNLVVNGIIIIISAAIYRSVESALYAIIVQYLTGVVINSIISGADMQKEALIITKHPEAVASVIMETVARGVTAIDARGMYTGEQKTMLLCVMRRHEVGTLKKLVHQIDPECFMLVSEVGEVFGVHFKQYK